MGCDHLTDQSYYDIYTKIYRYDIKCISTKTVPHNIEILGLILRDSLTNQEKYYPVYSAFHGLAVYMYDYIIGCKYNGSSLTGTRGLWACGIPSVYYC
jgi:hypothetical protein